jgi:prefoldin subunit 5
MAFEIIKPEERTLLADLRELFRGGREGRGLSDLRYLIAGRDAPGRGGHTRLPDRLLPYHKRRAGITDTEHIVRLKTYWNSETTDKIADLARILPLADFLKLHQDEDISRILEALWRTTRGEFESEDLESYIVKLENVIIPALQACQELENIGTQFGLQGVDFGDYTNLVKSLPGFEKFLELTKAAKGAAPIVKAIFSILVETTNDIDDDIRELDDSCSSARRALNELNTSADQVRQNIWEYKKAVKFSGLDEETIKEMIGEQMKMDGTPDLEDVETAAQGAKGSLESISSSLSQLEKKLSDIENSFNLISKGRK